MHECAKCSLRKMQVHQMQEGVCKLWAGVSAKCMCGDCPSRLSYKPLSYVIQCISMAKHISSATFYLTIWEGGGLQPQNPPPPWIFGSTPV